jgi:hypothetical protein
MVADGSVGAMARADAGSRASEQAESAAAAKRLARMTEVRTRRMADCERLSMDVLLRRLWGRQRESGCRCAVTGP